MQKDLTGFGEIKIYGQFKLYNQSELMLHISSAGDHYTSIRTTALDNANSVTGISHLKDSSGHWFTAWCPNMGGYKWIYNITNSDVRLKNSIKPSEENALKQINQIEHIEFDWKDNGLRVDCGYSAQNLKEINDT